MNKSIKIHKGCGGKTKIKGFYSEGLFITGDYCKLCKKDSVNNDEFKVEEISINATEENKNVL